MTIFEAIEKARANFTNEEKIAWRSTFSEPVMEKGKAELQKLARVSGFPEVLGAGYDALTLAAASHWFLQGQQSILDAMDALGSESPLPLKPLPNPFQATAEYRAART